MRQKKQGKNNKSIAFKKRPRKKYGAGFTGSTATAIKPEITLGACKSQKDFHTPPKTAVEIFIFGPEQRQTKPKKCALSSTEGNKLTKTRKNKKGS